MDAATQARLKSLESEFLAQTSAAALSSRSATADSASVEPLEVQVAKEILVREFGDEGLKYLVEGAYEPVGSRYFDYPIGADATYQYYLRCDARWVTTPWASYTYGYTETVKARIQGTVIAIIIGGESAYLGTDSPPEYCTKISGRMRTTITDNVTPTARAMDQYSVGIQTVGADPLYGIFPGPASGVKTTHSAWDGVYAEGFATKSIRWN